MKNTSKLNFLIYTSLIFSLLIFSNTISILPAQSSLDSLQQVLKQSDDSQVKVDIYNKIVEAYVQQSDSIQAVHNFHLAVQFAKELNYWKGLAQAHLHIAELYFSKNINDSLALYHFHEGIYTAKQAKDMNLQAEAYKRIGVIYRRKGNYHLALQNHQLSLQIYINTKNREGIALAQNNIGGVYGSVGNHALALDYILKSLKYWEETNNHKLIGTLSNNIAIVHMNQKNYKKALTYLFKSLEIMESLNNQLRVASASNNLGITFKELKDYRKSRFYYQKALTIYQELENDYGIARVSHNFGESYSLSGDYKTALTYLEQALEIRKKLNTPSGLASTMIQMGEVYHYLENYEQAELFLIQGKELAQEIGALDRVKAAVGSLARLYHAKGQYQKAYEAQLKFSQLSDSLLNTEMVRQITLIDANYSFQQQIDSLQQVKNQENATLKSEQINYRLWITLLIVSIIGLLLIIFLLISRQKNRRNQVKQATELQKIKEQLLQEQLQRKEIEEKKLQEQFQENQQVQNQLQLNLESKDFELTRQALYLLQKKQFLDKISDEVKEIAKSATKPIQDNLKALIKTIRKETSTGEEWQNFTQTFEMAHPDFFNRLQQRFPELTDYDIKLSALLRLGFDSRELSLILNITTDSVRKARTRLRKKLKLNEENLNEFLRDL